MCRAGSCYSLTWGFICGLGSQGSLATSPLSDMGFFLEMLGQESVVTIVSSHRGQLSVWLSKQRATTRKTRKSLWDFTESWECSICGDRELK